MHPEAKASRATSPLHQVVLFGETKEKNISKLFLGAGQHGFTVNLHLYPNEEELVVGLIAK